MEIGAWIVILTLLIPINALLYFAKRREAEKAQLILNRYIRLRLRR